MHIPGEYLSNPVCALTTLAASTTLGVGVWKARRGEIRSGGAALAAVGSLVFAVQMINFPIDPGTSGHLIGAALATVVLGPWGAMLALASVLAIQATVFGDGGIGSWGANVLTMAVVAPWTAWFAYRGLAQRGLAGDARRETLAWGLAAAASVLAAATACSLILAWGGAAPLGSVLPAMLLAHLPVGLAEGLATAAVALVVAGRSTIAPRAWLGAAAAVAVLVAPLASSAPDGLTVVAGRLGFQQTTAAGFAGLLPDYVWPGIGWAPLGVALAGLVGVAAVAAAGYLVGQTSRAPQGDGRR
ncbi:MAG TPA: energy-coupling factor ABC transporter permease [Pirellulales bacterium]